MMPNANIGAHILLVEDEPMIRMAVAEMLADSGFIVTEAATAQEALSHLVDQPAWFDAVILDLGLPDRVGDHLVADMRRTRPNLPIVITSGRGRSNLEKMFAAQTAVAVVAKPYQHSELLLALDKLSVGRKDHERD